MLNWIWLALVVLAVVIGGVNHQLPAVTSKAFEMAKFAVLEVALPLVGLMALWLGLMRLAERAGLVQLLARALRPLLRSLFPGIPADHPAMGSMLMNVGANMLGLSNAATPLGLRAMKDLESLNRHPGTATNAMCVFLVMNTSCVQLIPATVIAILAANGSANPTAVVGTALLATLCAAITGVTMAKLLEKLPMFRVAGVATPGRADDLPVQAMGEASAKSDESLSIPVGPTPWWGKALLAGLTLFFVFLIVRLVFPSWWSAPPAADTAAQGVFARAIDSISMLAIPFLLAFFPLYAALRRVRVYEEFVTGAKEGFEVALRIIPYLVAILVAIGMFRAAGGIELLTRFLGPVLNALGFPAELLPISLLRPLSGSGSLGLFTELVKTHGPDSLIARTAGTIYGSTETTFYVLAVYFGSVAVKRSRHALPAGLCADFVGVVASVIICWMMFG